LKVERGGTRSFGHHLTTVRPGHAVGEYYYLLRSAPMPAKLKGMLARPLRAVATRHHLRRPWWIPVTLVAELAGMGWALWLAARGPRLIGRRVGRGIGGATEADNHSGFGIWKKHNGA
jgi:hypothetical protein